MMIEPWPAACIIGATAWAQKNWWRRLVCMRSSQYSGSTVRQSWRSSRAALFTSTVTGPSCSATAATATRSAAMSRRSQCRNSAPVRAAICCPPKSSKSRKATRDPCAANCATISAPMPLAPPVTSTTRSFRLG